MISKSNGAREGGRKTLDNSGETVRIGPAARALRRRLGLSQEQFALRLGVARISISNYERDACQPSPSTLAAYRRECGIDPYAAEFLMGLTLPAFLAVAETLYRSFHEPGVTDGRR